MPRHQYRISSLFSQTSFCGETSGGIGKCRPFTLATFFIFFIYHVVNSDELLEKLEEEKQARKNAEEKINELKGGPQHF